MNSIQYRLFFIAVALLCPCFKSHAIEVQDGNPIEPTPASFSTYLASMPESGTSSSFQVTSAGTTTSNLGSFDIVIVPDATLSSNAPALAAFNRAAAQWEARISSPITVTINANLASLGAGTIGSTSTLTLQNTYNTVRNQMVAHVTANEPVDDAIVASLPTAAQFNATVPAGVTFNGNIYFSKANGKAMGFTGLDGTFGASDASITFSTNFTFDFDNSNGVTAGAMDFETVAAHEIGHALGFFSSVDYLDAGETSIAPTTLDLFRFLNTTNPTNAANFSTTIRNMVPGANDISDFVLNPWGMSGVEFSMSTGVVSGDGRQASHWKADELSGTYIGMMDPTLSTGTIQQLTEADFRAMDLIGYQIAAIPEPSTIALGFTGIAAIYWMRRRRAV